MQECLKVMKSHAVCTLSRVGQSTVSSTSALQSNGSGYWVSETKKEQLQLVTLLVRIEPGVHVLVST